MISEQREFWSKVAQNYDRVVDLQIGVQTRSMVRERLAREGPLGSTVEFGCGSGVYTETLAGRADRVIATDLSPQMLDLARNRVRAANVLFQEEDCQCTSFPDGSFDTAFLALVIHFTQPSDALKEMHRILRPGGALIIANVDLGALNALNRLRSFARMLYQGLVGYRTKPPRGFGRNMLTERQLCSLLRESSFKVESTETIKDGARSCNIPIEYVRARKLWKSTDGAPGLKPTSLSTSIS
jgi:ubiquinone/menaquinone biosynthesis C-methylase UbiE